MVVKESTFSSRDIDARVSYAMEAFNSFSKEWNNILDLLDVVKHDDLSKYDSWWKKLEILYDQLGSIQNQIGDLEEELLSTTPTYG